MTFALLFAWFFVSAILTDHPLKVGVSEEVVYAKSIALQVSQIVYQQLCPFRHMRTCVTCLLGVVAWL